ncbi:MAG: hypothetical protein Harvfovirus32_14 [Harvfovirus sp.]|uniref:Uncharacterized protein n=1 Tax=Harvfovirus sp. TaxID=2487768 RepID=A0A3G5A2G9_9VIRU|nr:MAG: hypothetical protein Harvfovirus32_14 [Harvfovirus sp.]
MTFHQSYITLSVTGFLTGIEVLVYSRINTRCLAAVTADESSNQIWTIIKNRDLSEVEDMIKEWFSSRVKSGSTMSPQTTYRCYARMLNGITFGRAVDLRSCVSDEKKIVMKDYRTCILGNGNLVDSYGFVVLNALIGLEWMNFFWFSYAESI